jgi:hypothetical protein
MMARGSRALGGKECHLFNSDHAVFNKNTKEQVLRHNQLSMKEAHKIIATTMLIVPADLKKM